MKALLATRRLLCRGNIDVDTPLSRWQQFEAVVDCLLAYVPIAKPYTYVYIYIYMCIDR